MPIFHVVSAAVAATCLFAAAPCFADQPDRAPDTAIAPTDNIFTSWFSGRAARADAADAAADSASRPATSRTAELVVNALGLLGISYRLGGTSPASGFDCSGMVRYVFQNAIGLSLPRRAEEISRVGTKIARSELKPGDLVFYKTLRNAVSHVGIYLGDNRFIHAPSAGGAVRVDDMSEHYWAARFTGARRIDS